jgi:serine/threonine-protein kinase
VQTNITSPGIVCGTPDYMAPEQGRGDPIDARSDLYACGVILFQLLTGRLPFEADSPTQVVLMHLSIPAPNPDEIAPEREIPEVLCQITRKALEKDAANRYQTADELAAALRAALVELDAPASGRVSIADLSVTCSSCGALVPRGQKFCGDCGARVTANASAPTRSAMAAPLRERPTSLPRLPLPFAAREEDLEWLDACRFEIGGSVAGVRILGDHGVGKTRLLREFLQVAAAAGDVIVETSPDPWWAEVGYYAPSPASRACRRTAAIRRSGAPPRPRRGAACSRSSAAASARRTRAGRCGRSRRPPA